MAKQKSSNLSGGRSTVRNAKAPTSRRAFQLSLVALTVFALAVIGYLWQRGEDDAAPVLIERDASVPSRPVGYVRGSPDAPVEIVEFADFECPGCGEFARLVEPEVRARLVETGAARFRFIDLQVNASHRNSPAASVAAACANDQGKFWEMHDRIFAGQAEWSSTATQDPKEAFVRYARQLGIDMTVWEECYDARRHLEKGAEHLDEARRVNLQFTPSFVIGNQMLAGGQSFDAIKAAVDAATAARAGR